MGLHPDAVPGLSPALRAAEPHRACAQMVEPARTIAERWFEEVGPQLHAVAIAGRDVRRSRLIFQWHGAVGVIGPLAEVHGVRPPVEQSGSRIEVVIAPPTTVHIIMIVWSPGSRPQPQVPIHDIL